MEDLKKHFPVLDSCTYLNTASNGIVPKPVMEWRRKHDLELMNQASIFRDKHKEHIEKIRHKVANFFDASIKDTALVPNLSFGMNTFLEGLPNGQKIVLLENDYPSVNWPVEVRDFNVCYAKIDENLEQHIEAAFLKHRPDVFMFSVVQWLTGIKMDLDFIKQFKSRYPNVLFVADGTQYLGTEPFNFTESGIDVLGASAYKWLTAGYGNGIFMVKESAKEKIHPQTLGFNSAERFESKATETAFIKHFEPGHQDTLNYGSLEQSLLFVESLGTNKIYRKVEELSKQAKAQFEELGLLLPHTLKRKQHSSIFNLKGDATLFQKLKEKGIICSPRGGGIRVSFHYYNSSDDLEKLVEVLSHS